MAKKLKSALYHFTKENNGSIKKTTHIYTCNYCKWKTVVNVTRMFDHLLKKCTKCPSIVRQTSGLAHRDDSSENLESELLSQSTSNTSTTNEKRKRHPQGISSFFDSITDNKQVKNINYLIYQDKQLVFLLNIR